MAWSPLVWSLFTSVAVSSASSFSMPFSAGCVASACGSPRSAIMR
jgi:hypothetical protein